MPMLPLVFILPPRRVLASLYAALQEERPELLALARGRLLPMLVACREPLTVAELVWATGAQEAEQVRAYLMHYVYK